MSKRSCAVCGGAGYVFWLDTIVGYGHGCDGTQESCSSTCPVPVPEEVEVSETCPECFGTGETN